MERQIPRGVPRIFPLVGHRDDVGVVQIRPIVISALEALRIGRRLRRIAPKPAAHVVVIALLAPQQPRERLPLHQPRHRRSSRHGRAARKIRPLPSFAASNISSNASAEILLGRTASIPAAGLSIHQTQREWSSFCRARFPRRNARLTFVPFDRGIHGGTARH